VADSHPSRPPSSPLSTTRIDGQARRANHHHRSRCHDARLRWPKDGGPACRRPLSTQSSRRHDRGTRGQSLDGGDNVVFRSRPAMPTAWLATGLIHSAAVLPICQSANLPIPPRPTPACARGAAEQWFEWLGLLCRWHCERPAARLLASSSMARCFVRLCVIAFLCQSSLTRPRCRLPCLQHPARPQAPRSPFLACCPSEGSPRERRPSVGTTESAEHASAVELARSK